MLCVVEDLSVQRWDNISETEPLVRFLWGWKAENVSSTICAAYSANPKNGRWRPTKDQRYGVSIFMVEALRFFSHSNGLAEKSTL